MKEKLFGKNLNELREVAATLGMPRFAATQMASWLYKRGVRSIDAMTDLSLRNRSLLAEHYDLGLSDPLTVSTSADGTKKYLYPVLADRHVESAYIPDGDRATLCVSSQAGCKMGCAFCMTGRQGFGGNLSTGEILNQMASLPERESLTNIVYMGMGEPLDNLQNVMRSLEVMTADWGYGWSPTRITLSTAGLLPGLRHFLAESNVHLAVSLHNPFPEERRKIMPIENSYPIREVVDLIRRHDFSHQRRVSFEYIILKGLNDTQAHIKELCRLLGGLSCRINLIRFHAIPDSPFVSPDLETVTRFRDTLTRKGLMTTIRASRGEDIQAACGLLSTFNK